MGLSSTTASQIFTPSDEEQTLLILKGLCPHNKGWYYYGHSHNEECWRCAVCGRTEYY